MATFITPVNVIHGVDNVWTDIDVSAHIPAGATGVILRAIVQKPDSYGIRKNGSTDNRTEQFRDGGGGQGHAGWCVGVDGNRIFEAYFSRTSLAELWLIGYFTDDAVFLTNAPSYTLSSTNTWEDADISSDTGANTAIAALLEMQSDTFRTLGLRKNGSTDNRTEPLPEHIGAAIGVDANEIFEFQSNNTSTIAYLLGYLIDEGLFNTNAVDKSTGTTGSYVDVNSSAINVVGGLYEVDRGEDGVGLRANGAADDIFGACRHVWLITDYDASHVAEQRIAHTAADLWEVGYFGSNPLIPIVLSVGAAPLQAAGQPVAAITPIFEPVLAASMTLDGQTVPAGAGAPISPQTATLDGQLAALALGHAVDQAQAQATGQDVIQNALFSVGLDPAALEAAGQAVTQDAIFSLLVDAGVIVLSGELVGTVFGGDFMLGVEEGLVRAVGQAVPVAVAHSLGDVERIANGTFDADASGWILTPGDGAAEWDAGNGGQLLLGLIPDFALVDQAGNFILDANGNYIVADPAPRTS